MKRRGLFAVVGAVCLLTANCSKDEPTGSSQGSGGTGGATTGAGGSGGSNASGGTTSSGGTAGSGGSSNSGGSGGAAGSGGGAGGTTTGTTGRDAAASGGASGSGGGGGTTKRDAAASGGASGGGGASTARGGATGNGGAKGGATGTAGSGAGGKTGAGGATGSGGATVIDAGATDGGTSGVVPSAGCGKAAGIASGRASIEVNGETREYILALPKTYDQNHAYKLIFAWHPWTGSAQMVASGGYFGLQKLSNDQAIFVAGEGQDFQDAGLGWGNSNGKDIDFYQAMLERFRSELCIDENRIFSTGFSFGAMFSFTLGCTADSMLRAIMPMAGNATTSGGCESGARKVAVMAFIGTDDSLISGHRQAVSTYAKRDGCTTTTETMNPSWCDGLNSSNLPCTCVSYQGCADGYPVISCEYKAGHQQAPNPGPIWDFVAQF
jgi:polyhydroxybutyrate depolymerase